MPINVRQLQRPIGGTECHCRNKTKTGQTNQGLFGRRRRLFVETGDMICAVVVAVVFQR